MQITPTTTVRQVMKMGRQAALIFLELRMDCVGCPMDRLCTLQEAANAYNLPPMLLLEKLQRGVALCQTAGFPSSQS